MQHSHPTQQIITNLDQLHAITIELNNTNKLTKNEKIQALYHITNLDRILNNK